jgi:hypothetical protein
LDRLTTILGFGDDTLTQNYQLDSLRLWQVDLFNLPADFDTTKVQDAFTTVLREIWSDNLPPVYLANRKISPLIAPSLFSGSDLLLSPTLKHLK